MKAKIMKTPLFHNHIQPVTFMLWKSFMIYFTLRPSDLITIDLRSYEQLLSLFIM